MTNFKIKRQVNKHSLLPTTKVFAKAGLENVT